MASELYVETLKGLTSGANANKVIIPSGQTLDASAGTTLIQQPTTIFIRTSTGTYSNNSFVTRAFDSTEYNTISGSSVDGSGYANLPAGTYRLTGYTHWVGEGTTVGESAARLYDHNDGVVLGYGVRGMSLTSNTPVQIHFDMIVTSANLIAFTVQSLTENAGYQDVNTFDGSPGNTLGDYATISTRITAVQLAGA